jgi:hypothetical protein
MPNDRAEAFYQSMSDAQYGPRNEGGSGPDGRIDYSSGGKDKNSFAPKDSIKYSTKGFLGNALSSMPSATYYTRLSICHPTIVHNLSLNNKKKIIIAETATTAIFAITDLEIIHTVSWNKQTRSALGIGANITIVETHGAALLDYINKACKDLGIKSPKEATYLLEIMFNNGNAENVEPGQSAYYFVYPIQFLNMNISISEKGGQYRIYAQEPGVTAYGGQVGPTIKNVSTIAASSLGEWTKGFQTFLNDCAKDEVKSKAHFIRDEYYIKIDDAWKDYKFSNLKNASKENNQSTRSHIDNSKLVIQIAKGSRIPDILNSIMGATEEFQRVKTTEGGFMREMGTDGKMTNSKSIPEIFRLVCDMRFGDYDISRKRYSRKYLYSFESYKDATVYSGELATQFNDKDVMKDKVTKLLEEQLLTKRYDYNFTGLNTEVLQFDINFDLTYFRSIPIRDGHQAQLTAVNDSHLMTTGLGPEGKEITKKRMKNDVPADLRKYIGKTYGPLSDQGLIYGANPQDADDLEKAQAALASETSTNIRKGSGLYIESYTLPSTQENISFHTLSSDTVDSGNALQQNVTPDKSTGRIKLGNMYMELTGGSELSEINIEIKGDPYWLGMSNLTKQFRNASTGIAEFAIYEQGAPMFWLNVNSPVEPDPDTGKMEFVNNVTISGIFKVKNVISRFVNGAFTQSLEAIRDISTNYELARSTLLKYTSEQEISLANRAVKEKASHQDAHSDDEKGRGRPQETFNREKFDDLQRNANLESQGYEERS